MGRRGGSGEAVPAGGVVGVELGSWASLGERRGTDVMGARQHLDDDHGRTAVLAQERRRGGSAFAEG